MAGIRVLGGCGATSHQPSALAFGIGTSTLWGWRQTGCRILLGRTRRQARACVSKHVPGTHLNGCRLRCKYCKQWANCSLVWEGAMDGHVERRKGEERQFKTQTASLNQKALCASHDKVSRPTEPETFALFPCWGGVASSSRQRSFLTDQVDAVRI
jgi:hypothetical protein